MNVPEKTVIGTAELWHGDCLAALRLMPDNSVDSVVTDPPYGLTSRRPGGRSEATRGAVMGGFMGLKWDYDVPSVEVWAECLRVLKPGGHLLAFADTRTQHRMAVRIEDAGFEIRDMLAWVYGSGFPKSHNGEWGGTALKPALEPITFARKPLIGTVYQNWREHGTGALNIDDCRVGDFVNTTPSGVDRRNAALAGMGYRPGAYQMGEKVPSGAQGRWPANLIHDGSDDVLAAFPQAPGQMADASTNSDQRKTQNTYGAMRRGRGDEPSADSDNDGVVGFKMKPGARRLDSGSAARFFYCAKASKKDRSEGCDRIEWRTGSELTGRKEGSIGLVGDSDNKGQTANPYANGAPVPRNHHPTVKPTDLMRYLCRLVTPAGGVVLDPFMGSGSTGKGAVLEGFRFIGCDLSAEYIEIASARIAYVQQLGMAA